MHDAAQNIEDQIPTLANAAFSAAFMTARRNGQAVTYVQGSRIVQQKQDGSVVTIQDFSMQQDKFYEPVTQRTFNRRKK